MNDDRSLVGRTLRGEREAFEMIILRYQQPLLNYIGRMVNDHELALDFTQEVFVKAYASLHSYNPSYSFSTWLYKIASNLVIDFWRKKKIPALSLDQGFGPDSPYPLQVSTDELPLARQLELRELRKKIELKLQDLPPLFKELFILRHINELSYEEIARIKGLPLGTVKNKIFHAKEMLRRWLEEEL